MPWRQMCCGFILVTFRRESAACVGCTQLTMTSILQQGVLVSRTFIALEAKEKSPQERAQLLSFVGAAYGVGFILGPPTGGFISKRFSLQANAWAAAAGCLVSILLVTVFIKDKEEFGTCVCGFELQLVPTGCRSWSDGRPQGDDVIRIGAPRSILILPCIHCILNRPSFTASAASGGSNTPKKKLSFDAVKRVLSNKKNLSLFSVRIHHQYLFIRSECAVP